MKNSADHSGHDRNCNCYHQNQQILADSSSFVRKSICLADPIEMFFTVLKFAAVKEKVFTDLYTPIHERNSMPSYSLAINSA